MSNVEKNDDMIMIAYTCSAPILRPTICELPSRAAQAGTARDYQATVQHEASRDIKTPHEMMMLVLMDLANLGLLKSRIELEEEVGAFHSRVLATQYRCPTRSAS